MADPKRAEGVGSQPRPADSSIYLRHGKRAFDLLVSVTMIVLTAPVQLACAVMVWVDAGLPIIYAQSRAGRFGQPFRIYKFRTMHNGTEAAYGGYPAASAVTRMGQLLRRTSLDELPQLFNVVRGDMSLVGPRPAALEHLPRYTEEQRRRLDALPGITGLAQVRYRNEATWSTRIAADVEYVESIRFMGDVSLILKTAARVVTGSSQVVGQQQSEVDDLGPGPEPIEHG